MAKKYLGAKLQRNHQRRNTIRKAFYITTVWYFGSFICLKQLKRGKFPESLGLYPYRFRVYPLQNCWFIPNFAP